MYLGEYLRNQMNIWRPEVLTEAEVVTYWITQS